MKDTKKEEENDPESEKAENSWKTCARIVALASKHGDVEETGAYTAVLNSLFKLLVR